MPIRVKCGGCKKTLSVKDHLAGKKIKCPVCQSVVAVPTSSPAKDSPPIAAPAPKPTANPTKPGVATKPAPVTKPPIDKSKSNGTPIADKSKSNGKPMPPPELIELPPENVEEEALAAFADEPKPVEDEGPPQTIDFKCEWCDEELKLPLDLGGKQSQCPNPECRRIIKVPLPKKVEKKDWRKMDRRGPAAAIVNQPEQLEDAWGTQDATRARQDSLAKAGAIEAPPKRSVGAAGWIIRGFYGVCAVVLIMVGILGLIKLVATKQQHDAVKEVQKLAVGPDASIKQPLLLAEAHRTLGLLHLREGKALKAKDHLQGAQSLIAVPSADNKNPRVNEQLFLIDLALSQVELGGDEDEVIAKKKIDWEKVGVDLAATLGKIKDPEAQALALREVGTRLIEKNQHTVAIGLAAKFSKDAASKYHAPFRQQIALRLAMKDQEKEVQQIAKEPASGGKEPPDVHARVGYAEGHARKDDYAKAWTVANISGPPKDRLDAYLGVAVVAWQRKNKDEASKFLKEAMTLVKEVKDQPWQMLQIVKLAARTEQDADAIKSTVKDLPAPFKLRAQLEIFLLQCENSPDKVATETLQEVEVADKDGATLALAWMALAQHNTRKGASRDQNRSAFDDRMAVVGLPNEIIDKIRPMVDVGYYLGTLK